MMTNHYTRLNDLTDEHVRILASSPHLRDLTFLDFEDNTALTERAFNHLALSPNLPSLSLVKLNVWDYRRQYLDFGDYWRELLDRRPASWAPALEARHGYLPWLHAEEHYGTPIRTARFLSSIPSASPRFGPTSPRAAGPRCPPRSSTRSGRASALILRLEPMPSASPRCSPVAGGELAATLEGVAPDPSLPDLRVQVRLTIAAAPAGLQLTDATGSVQTIAPRMTITVAIAR